MTTRAQMKQPLVTPPPERKPVVVSAPAGYELLAVYGDNELSVHKHPIIAFELPTVRAIIPMPVTVDGVDWGKWGCCAVQHPDGRCFGVSKAMWGMQWDNGGQCFAAAKQMIKDKHALK